MRAALLLVLLPLAGCFPLAGDGKPTSPVMTYRIIKTTKGERIAERAVVVGRGDLPDLAEAHGEPVGTLEAKLAGATEEQLTEAAQAEAAKRGGTHLLWTADASEVVERPNLLAELAAGYSEGQDRTACDNGQQGACIALAKRRGPAPTRSKVAGSAFLVIRVPPGQWAELREEIRPKRIDGAAEKAKEDAEAAAERDYQKCRSGSLNPEMCKRAKLPPDDQPHSLVVVRELHALDALGKILRPRLRQAGEVAPFDGLATDVHVGGGNDCDWSVRRLAVAEGDRRAGQLIEPRHFGQRRVPNVFDERTPRHDDRGRAGVGELLDVLALIAALAEAVLRELVRHDPLERGLVEPSLQANRLPVELAAAWPVVVREDHAETARLHQGERVRRVFVVGAGAVVDPGGDVVRVQAAHRRLRRACSGKKQV